MSCARRHRIGGNYSDSLWQSAKNVPILGSLANIFDKSFYLNNWFEVYIAGLYIANIQRVREYDEDYFVHARISSITSVKEGKTTYEITVDDLNMRPFEIEYTTLRLRFVKATTPTTGTSRSSLHVYLSIIPGHHRMDSRSMGQAVKQNFQGLIGTNTKKKQTCGAVAIDGHSPFNKLSSTEDRIRQPVSGASEKRAFLSQLLRYAYMNELEEDTFCSSDPSDAKCDRCIEGDRKPLQDDLFDLVLTFGSSPQQKKLKMTVSDPPATSGVIRFYTLTFEEDDANENSEVTLCVQTDRLNKDHQSLLYVCVQHDSHYYYYLADVRCGFAGNNARRNPRALFTITWNGNCVISVKIKARKGQPEADLRLFELRDSAKLTHYVCKNDTRFSGLADKTMTRYVTKLFNGLVDAFRSARDSEAFSFDTNVSPLNDSQMATMANLAKNLPSQVQNFSLFTDTIFSPFARLVFNFFNFLITSMGDVAKTYPTFATLLTVVLVFFAFTLLSFVGTTLLYCLGVASTIMCINSVIIKITKIFSRDTIKRIIDPIRELIGKAAGTAQLSQILVIAVFGILCFFLYSYNPLAFMVQAVHATGASSICKMLYSLLFESFKFITLSGPLGSFIQGIVDVGSTTYNIYGIFTSLIGTIFNNITIFTASTSEESMLKKVVGIVSNAFNNDRVTTATSMFYAETETSLGKFLSPKQCTKVQLSFTKFFGTIGPFMGNILSTLVVLGCVDFLVTHMRHADDRGWVQSVTQLQPPRCDVSQIFTSSQTARSTWAPEKPPELSKLPVAPRAQAQAQATNLFLYVKTNAIPCRRVDVEIQGFTEAKAYLNGTYAFHHRDKVGDPVFVCQTCVHNDEQMYLYHTKSQQDKQWYWYISDKADMEAKNAQGWAKAIDDARRPQDIRATWQSGKEENENVEQHSGVKVFEMVLKDANENVISSSENVNRRQFVRVLKYWKYYVARVIDIQTGEEGISTLTLERNPLMDEMIANHQKRVAQNKKIDLGLSVEDKRIIVDFTSVSRTPPTKRQIFEALRAQAEAEPSAEKAEAQPEAEAEAEAESNFSADSDYEEAKSHEEANSSDASAVDSDVEKIEQAAAGVADTATTSIKEEVIRDVVDKAAEDAPSSAKGKGELDTATKERVDQELEKIKARKVEQKARIKSIKAELEMKSTELQKLKQEKDKSANIDLRRAKMEKIKFLKANIKQLDDELKSLKANIKQLDDELMVIDIDRIMIKENADFSFFNPGENEESLEDATARERARIDKEQQEANATK